MVPSCLLNAGSKPSNSHIGALVALILVLCRSAQLESVFLLQLGGVVLVTEMINPWGLKVSTATRLMRHRILFWRAAAPP